MRTIFLLISLIFSAPVVHTAETDTTPGTLPPALKDLNGMEPEVTIVHRDGETVEEYRIQGRLYMIKVTPDAGREYFLIDSDGNGSLDARRSQLDPQLMIPSWILFKW